MNGEYLSIMVTIAASYLFIVIDIRNNSKHIDERISRLLLEIEITQKKIDLSAKWMADMEDRILSRL